MPVWCRPQLHLLLRDLCRAEVVGRAGQRFSAGQCGAAPPSASPCASRFMQGGEGGRVVGQGGAVGAWEELAR